MSNHKRDVDPATPAHDLSEADRRFLSFHQRNPHVYNELVELARIAKNRGRDRVGIRMLWEAMRWNRFISVDHEPDDHKLNNNYHSRYARLIMAQEPDLAGLFELRELKL